MSRQLTCREDAKRWVEEGTLNKPGRRKQQLGKERRGRRRWGPASNHFRGERRGRQEKVSNFGESRHKLENSSGVGERTEGGTTSQKGRCVNRPGWPGKNTEGRGIPGGLEELEKVARDTTVRIESPTQCGSKEKRVKWHREDAGVQEDKGYVIGSQHLGSYNQIG